MSEPTASLADLGIAYDEATRDQRLAGATTRARDLLDLYERARDFSLQFEDFAELDAQLDNLRNHIAAVLPSGLAAVNAILAEMRGDTAEPADEVDVLADAEVVPPADDSDTAEPTP